MCSNLNMCSNERLIKIRKDRKLSLKKAAKLCHLSYLSLKNMEEGYWKIKGKRLNKVLQGYGLPLDYFDDAENKDYIFIQSNISKEEKGFRTILNRLFNSWISLVLVLLLLMVNLIILPWSLFTISNFTNSPLSFYSESYQEVYKKITKEGENTDLGLSYILYDTQGKGMEFSNDGKEHSVFNVSKNPKYPHIFLIRQSFEDNGIDYSFLYDNYLTHQDLVGTLSFQAQDNLTFTIKASFVEGKMGEIDSVFYKDSSSEKVIFLDEDDSLYKDAVKTVQNVLPKAFEAIKSDFKALFSYDFDSFFHDFTYSKKNAEQSYDSSLLWGMISSISIITSIALLIAIVIVKKDLTEKKKSFFSSIEPSIVYNDFHTLPKNLSFSPMIKDGYLRIFGIILLLFGSSALALRFYLLLFASTDVGSFFPEIIKMAGYIYPIAFLLILFLKLNGMSKDKKVFSSAITMLYLGLVFFVFEVFTSIKFKYDDALMALLVSYFPGNIFWSIGHFMVIASLLFSSPNWIKTKKGLILFRLLSLIPVIYFVVSYSLNIAIKNHLLVLPDPVEFLFVSKNIIVALFAIAYLYFDFFLRFWIRKKYGNQSEVFMTSNQYLFLKNISATILVLLLCLLDYLLSNYSISKSLGFGKNTYIFVLAPVFLFYRQRIPPKSTIQSILFNFFNIFASTASYWMIGLYFLLN